MSAVVMSPEQINKEFSISPAQLDSWEADATAGILHGEPRGLVVGRPLKFGEEMAQVGFKETLTKIEQINQRAQSLGMSRSEYLRHLVNQDLATA